MEQLKLGNITVDVIQKNIKNIHLSVHPPTGRVRISAPTRLDIDTIRVFAVSKLSWIKKQQAKFEGQKREAPREFLNRESHYFKGKRYLLKVIEKNAVPRIELKHNKIELYVRPQASKEKMKSVPTLIRENLLFRKIKLERWIIFNRKKINLRRIK